MEQQYTKYVKRAANFAVIVAATLIIAKAFAWWQTGSMAILAAMTDSLVDLFASLTNMLVLRFALQPADDDHTFGHGKAESLAALAQSAFNPRIIGIHDVKTRRAGAIRFIQLHLELDDHLPLVVAHDITDSLEQKILTAFPHSEVIIHQEPTTIVKQEKQ